MDLNLSNVPRFSADVPDLLALWKLGMINVEEVQALASELLSCGIVANQLIDILVLSEDESDSIRTKFNSFLLQEEGGDISNRDAIRRLAGKISISILDRAITPMEGATFLWNVVLRSHEREFHELDPFIYAASEMRDRPADHKLFEDAILNEAKDWASRHKLYENGRSSEGPIGNI
ncbi:hypothetical protein [Dyella acidisoli]|uniref:Uncharacterized protein n=1 Tax=Dyella acidisoli TaxID=1867834 RepID=A0ABQ5XNX8_9GAMM|nr:hypothetical protein [Dyella acidisoli]GLQ93431.1 hypothetical protein GCM10007901_23820 [Dyella acidisoli]